MLMLSIAWLVGINVTFLYMSLSPEPSWRDKFVAERNVRRAIAYRYTRLKGGRVAESAHGFGLASESQQLPAEGMNRAPYGLDGENGNAGGPEQYPGAEVRTQHSLIELERQRGDAARAAKTTRISEAEKEVVALQAQISTANRQRREEFGKLGTVRDTAKLFGAEMEAFRYIISSFQQRVFNIDYEIHRVTIERDALAAELAQIRGDFGRVSEQIVTLEDQHYELRKNYERTVKTLGLYQTLDKDLPRLADEVGRGWLHGQVIAVGADPRTGIVTISIGSQDGVALFQEFTVYRGTQFLGKIQIEEVDANHAIGRLKPEFRGKVTVVEGCKVKSAEAFGGALKR
jgi:hypothetical protein